MSEKIHSAQKAEAAKSVNKASACTDNSGLQPSQESLSRTVTSEAIFAGARELIIRHADDAYRLRITNQGKLILTK